MPIAYELASDTYYGLGIVTYILHFSCSEWIFGTHESYQVDLNDQNVGLGCWLINDPTHPDNQHTPVIQIVTTNLTEHQAPSPVSSESAPDTHQSETWGPAADEPIAAPGPLDEALAATLNPVVSLQGSLPLDPPQPEIMSANVTTIASAPNPPSNGGMRGVPPTIFNGTQSHAEDFWGQFRRFKMVNRTHDAMKVPFDRVLTALTYMRGPLINDWVDQQEKKLASRIDTSTTNWVLETNEILWNEFETAFLTAWTDTSKKQNAYDQLM